MYNILVDGVLCIGCKQCELDCPQANIEIYNKKAKILRQDCIKCGHCLAICPKNAIEITDFEDEIVDVRNVYIKPQDILDKLRFRRSIRDFREEKIDKKILDDILEAGRLSQSGSNKQDVRYVVIERDIKEIEEIAVRKFIKIFSIVKKINKKFDSMKIEDDFMFKGAPLAICIIGSDKVDASIVATNMIYVAEAHGLGTLYSGFFSKVASISKRLKKKLGLRRGEKLVTTLVLGYTDKKYFRNPPRKKLNATYM